MEFTSYHDEIRSGNTSTTAASHQHPASQLVTQCALPSTRRGRRLPNVEYKVNRGKSGILHNHSEPAAVQIPNIHSHVFQTYFGPTLQLVDDVRSCCRKLARQLISSECHTRSKSAWDSGQRTTPSEWLGLPDLSEIMDLACQIKSKLLVLKYSKYTKEEVEY